MKNIIAIGTIIILTLVVLIQQAELYNLRNKEINRDTIYIPTYPNFLESTPQESLQEALDYFGVKHSEIVYAQAVLETGHFKSRICREYNNLFGLYNSKKKDYYRFNHWSQSVKAYVDMVQYKYNKGDYYEFLDSLGYAADPMYTRKLKKLIE